VFFAWRDTIAAASGRRQADYAWTVLARVLSWSLNRGHIGINPCERGGRLYRGGSRVEKIWTKADEAAFLERAPAHLHLPLLMALWTGQRQGDLLRLPWSSYDGTHIRLRQGKTGARVVVPVGAPLKSMLDASAKRSTIILTTSDGKPWTSDGFRASWRKACERAGIVGVTFHDLRGTAITRLALAGCTEAEIGTITGHSLRSVRAILDAAYLHRDPALAESAIRKLERRTKTPN
jgi:integrase